MAEKNPFNDVDIIHPSGPTYPSIMFVLEAKAGFKWTLGDGLRLAFTAPAKVFSGVLEKHLTFTFDKRGLPDLPSLRMG